MDWTWGDFWRRSSKLLKTCWLITAGLVAVYIGVIEPREMAREVGYERSTGLGAVAGGGSIFPWRQHVTRESLVAQSTYLQAGLQTYNDASPAPPDSDKAEERKLVRTSAISMVVKQPASAAEEIRTLAESANGFLVRSQTSGEQGSRYASLEIRVPVARFNEVRAAILKLGVRVESDRLEAQDVTKDYVDREAQLRSLRAQEQQYLNILKRAATVKDTLEVSDQLNRVRGEIEQRQAEFIALSKQTETVEITLTLTADTEAQVFGIHWRPLYQLKIAARNGLEGIADYIAAMVAVGFFLPTVLLWLGTIVLSAAFGWRILRWASRFFFASPETVLTEKGTS